MKDQILNFIIGEIPKSVRYVYRINKYAGVFYGCLLTSLIFWLLVIAFRLTLLFLILGLPAYLIYKYRHQLLPALEWVWKWFKWLGFGWTLSYLRSGDKEKRITAILYIIFQIDLIILLIALSS